MKLNVIIKFAFVAVLTTALTTGCEDACEKTDQGFTSSYRFRIRAFISGPDGLEIAGKTIQIRTYKEPCGELPKGHNTWATSTDESGWVNGGWATYNIDNEDDLVVITATLVDGENTQTKTETYRGGNMYTRLYTSSVDYNVINFEFTP